MRRSILTLLGLAAALGAVGPESTVALAADGPAATAAREPAAARIDRHAVVTRHHVVLTRADPLATLQVGNGEFAFAVDITGLQTFPEEYREGIQLGTQAQWGWGSAANPEQFTREDVLSPYEAHGRTVVYADGRGGLHPDRDPDRARRANTWLRENPYRLQLGRLGLHLAHADGTPVRLAELRAIRQVLELWSGTIHSHFECDGQPVRVETLVHPRRDLVAVRVESPLIPTGRLGLEFAPAAAASNVFTELVGAPGLLRREVDGRHRLTAPDGDHLEAILACSPAPVAAATLPDFATARVATRTHWEAFWRSGGAVDLSGSRDPRWRELERRIVLSQYQTAIQSAGSLPPQETGLAQNSWFGKFHLEMHWWHAAHFPLWGRPELLERSMGWYAQILPAARALARRNGYSGARWPKMVGPDGADSPSPVGGFLIWQQPHPIYLAELLWRAQPGAAVLGRYGELVDATAEFMASYAVPDPAAGGFVLGPPLIPAQESYGPWRASVRNPTFELAYWHWGLQQAQEWRRRSGRPREPRWDEVCRGLARPRETGGRYDAIAVEPYTLKRDHPSLLQAYGFLPLTPLIDATVMGQTLEFVLREWEWNSTWGWDYPVLAMTAARLGRAEVAVEALLRDTPKNRFLPNGHNYQRPNLPLYLPGNGGLLAAVALMAAGWDGASGKPAPGFPDPGPWSVRWEGLHPLP